MPSIQLCHSNAIGPENNIYIYILYMLYILYDIMLLYLYNNIGMFTHRLQLKCRLNEIKVCIIITLYIISYY